MRLQICEEENKNVKVSILTSNNSNISKIDIQKFNKEYPILEIGKTNKFHDRFIIIDNKELYHCGASLKDLGKKCFAISKMESIDFNFINKSESNIKYLEKVVEEIKEGKAKFVEHELVDDEE